MEYYQCHLGQEKMYCSINSLNELTQRGLELKAQYWQHMGEGVVLLYPLHGLPVLTSLLLFSSCRKESISVS